MSYEEADDLINRYIAIIKEEQKSNPYKYAYITGVLESHLKSALCGYIDMTIRTIEKQTN